MTIADHKGSDQLAPWIQQLHDRYQKNIDIDGVADVSNVPKPLQGFLRATFRNQLAYSVMLDWDGTVVRQGVPDARLEIEPQFAEALLAMEVGHELIAITWLHQADRGVLKGHPRSDEGRPLTGVFYTRSPARPNPLGLHPVTVRAMEGRRLRVGPIEAFDGTPVVDIKSASTRADV